MKASAPVAITRDPTEGSQQCWTYAELWRRSRSAAVWLGEHGIRAGDRVVVEAVADVRVAALLYGCSMTGAVFVPLPEGTTDHRREQILDDAQPALVISPVGGRGTIRLQDIGAHVDLSDAGEASTAVGSATVDPPAVAVLLYTSGTTARPKGIICPQASVIFAVRAIQARLNYRPDDVVYCRLPLSFDYGLYQLLLAATAGAHVVLAGSGSGPDVLSSIRRTGATVVPVVPSIAAMLLRLAGRDSRPCRVRLFTNTGEDMPATMIDDLRRRFPAARVQLMFGISECKRVAIAEPDDDRVRPGSAGRPLDGTTVKILNDAGDVVAAGEPGQIVVAGRHVMGGYWRSPELSRQVFRQDAGGNVWLFTGDYGYLDEDGHLYFQGRRDQVFKRQGVRVSVVEIEAAVSSIPEVNEAALVPPSATVDMVLFVVTTVSPAEILRRLRDLLEPARMPAICRRLKQLPRGTNGKLDRSALAALALEGE